MMDSAAIVSAEGLVYAYHGHAPVIKDVSLTIFPGEVITLLGPNGAGKSTLLNCLAGLFSPQSGHVFLDGKKILQLRPSEVASRIAYVPQSASAAFGYAVREYIAMGRAPYHGIFRRPTQDDYAIVDLAMADLDLKRLSNKLYTELSGGERQMVNICRAIAQEPAVVLFDEPTSALDYGNQLRVLRLIRRLSLKGYAVLMTTHNPDHPFLLGGRVAIIDREGGLQCGSAEEMMTEERLSVLYRADLHIMQLPGLDRTACIPGIL